MAAADIIIADDEPLVRRLMEMALTRAGYRIETAPHGEAALALINAHPPRVLVTDLEMPVMDGESLIREVRAAGHEFPIFVLTSKTAIDHRGWSAQYASLRFLEKPVSMSTLLSQLANTLRSVERKSGT